MVLIVESITRLLIRFDTVNGERIILDFEGENSFVFIQETSNNNNLIENVDGEIEVIGSVFGVLDNNNISWTMENIDYKIYSTSLDKNELLEIANSINTVTTIK